jgi:hypothetical protein
MLFNKRNLMLKQKIMHKPRTHTTLNRVSPNPKELINESTGTKNPINE